MVKRRFKEGVDLKRPPYARPQPGDPNHDRMIFRNHTDQTATGPDQHTLTHTQQITAETAAAVGGLIFRAGGNQPLVIMC